MSYPPKSSHKRRQRLVDVILNHPQLRRYAAREELPMEKDLVDFIRQSFPPHLAEHVSPLSLRNQQLVVLYDEPQLATELRFLETQLINTLRSRLIVTGINFRLKPVSSAKPYSSSAKPRVLSQRTSDELQTLAESISHPGLQAALSKLAKRGPQK